MKSTLLISTTFVLFFAFIVGCNKTSSPEPETASCNTNSFTDSLAINFKPDFVEEDNKGNITILGNNEGLIAIVRYNAEGEFLWHKEYPQLQGRAHGIVFIDENSFFIKTSTNHYEYELYNHTYDNVWIQNGVMQDASYNYINTFELVTNMQPKLQLPNTNTSFLTKLNAGGNVLWTKEFEGDYCKGNSFYRIDQNNFLFLTSNFYGPYFDMIDHEGFDNDTIIWPFDRNNRTVYQLNAEGEQIWSTEISGIFESDKLEEDQEFYTFLPQAITKNGEYIIVNTLNTTHQLTASGDIVKDYQPLFDFEANQTLQMIRADETANYFFGLAQTSDNEINDVYWMKYDVSQNQTIWKKEKNILPNQVSPYDNGDFLTLFYEGNQSSVRKYNDNCDQIWENQMETINSEIGIRAIEASCNGGAIIVPTHYLFEYIIVIRTDKDGNY